MKWTAALALTIFFVRPSISEAQTVEYEVLEDNPKFTNFMVGYEPFVSELSPINFPISHAITIDYVGKKLPVGLHFNWAKAWLDNTFLSYYQAQGIKPALNLEIGAYLSLVKNSKSKNVRINLGSHDDGNGYTITKYIMVPTTVFRTINISGGLLRTRTSFSNDGWESITLNGQLVADGVGVPVLERINIITNIYTSSIYGGFSFINFRNIAVKTDVTRGLRRRTAIGHFYLQGIFAPVVNLGTFEDTRGILGPKGEEYKLNRDGEDGYRISRFGYKLGYTISLTGKETKRTWFAWKIRFEGGSKPGIQGGNLYFLLGLGFNINANLGS